MVFIVVHCSRKQVRFPLSICPENKEWLRHLAGVHLHNSWKQYFAFQPLSEKRLAQNILYYHLYASSAISFLSYRPCCCYASRTPWHLEQLLPSLQSASCPPGCKAERLPVISVGPLWDKLVANICNESDNLKTLFQHYTCQMSHDLDFFPS